MYKAQIAKKELKFLVSVDEDMAIKSEADKLKQILINLLSNAVKFTPSKGQIKITLAHNEKQANPVNVQFAFYEGDSIKANLTPIDDRPSQMVLGFTIEDSGIGIKANELSNLFKCYQ